MLNNFKLIKFGNYVKLSFTHVIASFEVKLHFLKYENILQMETFPSVSNFQRFIHFYSLLRTKKYLQ